MNRVLNQGVRYLVAIAIGLLAASALVLAQGEDIITFLNTIGSSSFGGDISLLNFIRWSTPLILSGLAFIIAGRAGVFNIGVEGQIIVGSLFGAIAGRYLELPTFLAIPATILAGILGGVVCALPAAWLYKRFGVNEIVTTLMLNYVAVLVCNLVVREIFLPLSSDGAAQQTITTEPILAAAQIPTFTGQSEANWSTSLMLVLVIISAVLLLRTLIGYQITATGMSQRFAAFAGIQVRKVQYRAFLVSGAVAGLIGALEIQGVLHSYIDGSLTNYGYNGILVGLVGMNNPIGILGSGLFLGVLENSKLAISQFTNVSPDMVVLISGVFILFFAIDPLRRVIRTIGNRNNG